jgi:hypothetical protein
VRSAILLIDPKSHWLATSVITSSAFVRKCYCSTFTGCDNSSAGARHLRCSNRYVNSRTLAARQNVTVDFYTMWLKNELIVTTSSQSMVHWQSLGSALLA